MKKLFIALSFILFLTYGIPLIFNESILLYFGDSIETMYPYFVHLSEQIRSGVLFQWNHSMGFGTNNMVNFFNGLGSPFVYISALFPRLWLPHLFLFFDVVRFYVLAYFTWLWSGKLFEKEDTRIIFSLFVVLSGWVMHFIHFGFYLDGYMYLPLLLYLSDEVIENRKRFYFPVIVALIAFVSPYFLYMHSLYLLMYQLFRFGSRDKLFTKSFGISFLKVFGLYLIGVGLAAFVLLPEIQIVLSSPRIEITWIDKLGFDFSLHRLYNFFSSFLSPVLNDYNPNLFFSRYNVLDKSIFYNYTSIFTIFALAWMPWLRFPQKRAYLIFLGVLIILSFIPLSNTLLNGNDNVRWHYMISITALIGLGYFLDHFDALDAKQWIYVIVLMGYLGVYLISRQFDLIDMEFSRMQYVIVGVVFVSGILYMLFMSRPVLRFYLILVVVFELVFILLFRMNNGFSVRYIKAEDFSDMNKAQYVALYQDLLNEDDEFERIDVFNAYGNDAIMNGYPGFTFYSSLYNHEIRSLLDERFTPNWNMGYAPSKMLIKQFAMAKYYVTDTGFDNAPYGYNFLRTELNKDIYIQHYPSALGYAYENEYDINSVLEMDKSIQDFYMLDFALVENGDLINRSSIEPELISQAFQNDYISFKDINAGYYIIDYSKTNPNARCQFDFYKNGHISITQEIQEYGYTYLSVDDAYDGLYAYCTSIYNANEYVSANIYYVSFEQLDEIYSKLAEKPKLIEVEMDNDRILAEISLSADSNTISTVIAYDVGWNVKVDGLDVETFKVNDSFLGFNVNSGQHSIEMSYTAPGFKQGSVISWISLIILVFKTYIEKGTHRGKRAQPST